MENIHYITYATHDEGSYKELINNKYNIKINNIGWNHKWKNLKQKLKNVYKYILNKNDNDIIVFFDGFDSIINKYPKNLLEIFKSYNCKILFSKNFNILNVQKKIFKTRLEYVANTGLYMGYVKELKKFFKYILKKKGYDDQVLVNKYIYKFDFIKIDTKEVIFKNLNYYERYSNKNFNSYFLQTPGVLTINRIIRAFIEYYSFFIKEILIILLIVTYYLTKEKYNKCLFIFFILIIYILYYKYSY
jgi:hypothetical protein